MAVDEKRWGMLFCPKQSARRSRKYLERLEKILAEKGVAYDLVQSELILVKLKGVFYVIFQGEIQKILFPKNDLGGGLELKSCIASAA